MLTIQGLSACMVFWFALRYFGKGQKRFGSHLVWNTHCRMTSMKTETIAERICRTKSLAARHMLQDEAARFGAQGIVSEALEAKLLHTEVGDRSNEQSRSMA